MNEKLLFGEPVAAWIREATRLKVRLAGITPVLAVLFLGENADDTSYRRELIKQAAVVGMIIKEFGLPADVDAPTLKCAIAHVNRDDDVHGVLVQTIRTPALRDIAIHSLQIGKDAEGITANNVLGLEYNEAKIVPCTASAILALIKSVYPGETGLQGKVVTLVNSSPVIGIPLGELLQQAGAMTLNPNRYTTPEYLKVLTRMGDIVVTATGKRGLLNADHFTDKNPVVIDASIIRMPDGRIVGDVEHSDALYEKVKMITPVPKGVGPVTVATLLYQTALLCELFKGKVPEHHQHHTY